MIIKAIIKVIHLCRCGESNVSDSRLSRYKALPKFFVLRIFSICHRIE